MTRPGIFLLVALLPAFGCSTHRTTGTADAARYELVAVNGMRLPYTMASQVTIVSGVVRLHPDGTFGDTVRIRGADGVTQNQVAAAGRYERRGGAILMMPSDGENYVLTIATGGELRREPDEGVLLTYQPR